MKFDKKKSCFVNDNGSKLSSSDSVCAWSDRKYIKWLRDAVNATGRQTRDNTHFWRNGIKYLTGYKNA